MVVWPPCFRHAVQQDDVDVVHTQLEPVALQVAAGIRKICRVALGLNDVLVAWHALERLAKVDVRAVLVGNVEETDAMIERVPDDAFEPLHSEPSLVARSTTADAAGSHTDQGDLDTGLAERDEVGGGFGQGRPAAPVSPPAAKADASETVATTAVVAVAVLTMKSRRFTWPVMTLISALLSVQLSVVTNA